MRVQVHTGVLENELEDSSAKEATLIQDTTLFKCIFPTTFKPKAIAKKAEASQRALIYWENQQNQDIHIMFI